jgi:hypothetical protein
MTAERAEAGSAARLQLRAAQLAVHLLSQREHGPGPLAVIFAEAADTHAEAAELFAAALGLLARTIPGDVAQEVAEDLCGHILTLMMRTEGGPV